MNVRLSVCVPALYPGLSCADGIRRAAAQGAQNVEIWSWWDQDVTEIKQALDETGCTMAAVCTRFISLVDRECLDAYLEGLRETVLVCRTLGCRRIITQVGKELGDIPRDMQHAQLVTGLKAAAALLEGTGITLVFEPLNTRVDHKGYYLYSSDEGAQLVREVDHPQVRMLFDIYHQQIMEGDIMKRLDMYLPYIAHIHMAAVPGRGRLQGGELNYENILRFLDQKGYPDFAAMELFCREPDEEIAQWTAFVR